ncbi:MAG: DNA-3-methyladenine glycosylase [Verrucomicrobia bacterium]|nr:DNA-3-methyladenine glycosylase [Verrucomicrobiota bacterium]
MPELDQGFFTRDPVSCASELIGCHFRWRDCTVRIVETEAYDSRDDPACHTWFRPSARAFVEAQQAGDAYVYLNYGVHWLFNLLVKGPRRSGFVLLRAIEPLLGIERMRARRPGVPDHQLGAGPGKLTRALGIDGSTHGVTFLGSHECGITLGKSTTPICGTRIGISQATHLPWRFGDPNSPALSRKFT